MSYHPHETSKKRKGVTGVTGVIHRCIPRGAGFEPSPLLHVGAAGVTPSDGVTSHRIVMLLSNPATTRRARQRLKLSVEAG